MWKEAHSSRASLVSVSLCLIGNGYRITQAQRILPQQLVSDIMMQKRCLLLALAVLMILFTLSWINLLHLYNITTTNYVKQRSATSNINVKGELTSTFIGIERIVSPQLVFLFQINYLSPDCLDQRLSTVPI